MNRIVKKVITPSAMVAACIASAYSASAQLWNGGDVIVSESYYQDTGAVAGLNVGANLPGGGTAVANGAFPSVFLNDTPDSSFGVTSPITIQNYTQNTTLNLPASQMTTSFSSKSEISLNFSSDGSTLDFMGYVAPVGAVDVSNSSTPGNPDPSNTDTASPTYRAVGQLSANGALGVTPVNSYSGNNGRAAIVVNNVNGTGANNIYTVGNAGNGSQPEPASVVSSTGVQLTPVGGSPASTTVVGQQFGSAGNSKGYQYGFSVTQVGDTADNSGKDNNFRGETIFNNTLYVTKGSGSQGIDSVFQVGTTGSLPTAADASSTTISILPGFNTTLSKSLTTGGYHPFGLFFANATTLYVADEGDAVLADAGTSVDPNAGLEKWSLISGVWHQDYTLRTGLFGSYNPANYGGMTVTTDGLRDLAGRVNADGTVTLYSVTSTLDSNPNNDAGADPNKLVQITDTLADTTLAQASGEAFSVDETAATGEVIRGVAIAPVPEAGTWYAGAGVLAMISGRILRLRKK
jgi:hypothetical protein